MALSVAAAYAQIKDLENAGVFTLPRTMETVTVGTIDPRAGAFAWSVPTVEQTTVIPPTPPARINTIITKAVGVVHTDAVDLHLRFDVIPQPREWVFEPDVVRRADTGRSTGTVITARTVHLRHLRDEVVADALFDETNGGVTITGFPTVESAADHITVDAGLVCSTEMRSQMTSPPVTTINVAIDIPGYERIFLDLFVLRPPVVGIGAFTIPALPMTMVYAPPQGVDKKNATTFATTETVSRTVASAITDSTSTKTAQAYSPAELIGKVASAIGTVVAVVGTGGAGGGGGASVAGAFAQLGAALFGGAKEANDKTADAAKALENQLKLISGILDAVGDGPEMSESTTITVQSDHSMTITVANMQQYGSAAGLGPGVGDRIVYLRDVKVVWMAVNGEVGIHILGAAGIGANAVGDLMHEKARLRNGDAPTLGLDLQTIDSLLAVDPLVNTTRRPFGWLGTPRIAAPRFEPARPPGRSGSSTGSAGDQFQASFEVTDGTKRVVTSTSTRITDNKPGWAAVLFGAAENEHTTTTSTFTTTQVTEDRSSDKVVTTITLHSAGPQDPYDVKIFYDNLFGTHLAIDADSPLLQGSAGVDGGWGRVPS